MRFHRACLIAGIVWSTSVQAELVIDNLNPGGGTVRAFTSAPSPSILNMAVKFTAADAFSELSNVKLNLFQSNGGAGTYTVSLWSNTGTGGTAVPLSQLGGSLASGNWSDLGTSATSYLELNNINLGASRPAGSYWLSVASTFYFNGNQWAQAGSFSSASSDLNATWNGVAWTNRSDWGFANLGASVTTAVPEPATSGIALAGLAYGGYLMKRRRRLPSAGRTAAA